MAKKVEKAETPVETKAEKPAKVEKYKRVSNNLKIRTPENLAELALAKKSYQPKTEVKFSNDLKKRVAEEAK